jgi:hypothetical protein
MFRCDGRHTCGVKYVDRRGDRGVLGVVSFWGLAECGGPSWVQSARRTREPSVAGGASPVRLDRVEGYLERTARRKFYLAIAYPPSMRLGQLYSYGVARKAALVAFEAYAVEALRTVDVSRTETKYWS